MMFKSDSARGELNGFLDGGSHIKGDLHFEDTFRVDGRITGKVVSKGDLVVGERGEIQGEIDVGRVFVSGTVRGSIRAQRIEVTVEGKVYAELETAALVIEDGAFLEGSCSMVREGEARSKPAAGVVAQMPASQDSASS